MFARRIAFASFVAGALALSVPVFAQKPANARAQFRADVNYIHIDVYPTRNGLAVPDLQQEDFEVFENGVPQKVEQLEAVIDRNSSQAPRLDLISEAAEPLGCISGTKFILNAHDSSGPARRISAVLSASYRLGYYSSEKLDDRFHAIIVRVKRPGVQVRTKSGYVAAAAASRSSGTPRTP